MKGIKITARRLNKMPTGKRHALIYMDDKDAVMAVPCYGNTWFFPEGMNPERTYHFATAVRYGDDTLEIRLWDTDEIIEKKGFISWTVLASLINERIVFGWRDLLTVDEEIRAQKEARYNG